jgi:cell division septal protein FtsQ
VGRVAARRRTTARTAVLPVRRSVLELARFAPSGRSVIVGVVLLLLAVGGYFAARDTSLFAVRAIDVRGGTPALRSEVRVALAAETGQSLLRVDSSALDNRLSALSGLRSFSYDRAFPHTLRVVVRAERPVLVLRQGSDAYLVAMGGRVLRPLAHPQLSSLPRLYVKKDVKIAVGETPSDAVAAGAAAAAVVRSAVLPGGAHFVDVAAHDLTVRLGAAFELRLGDASDLRLKIAIARRILAVSPGVTAGSGYLDVSVPERPVLAPNSQVGG